MRQENKDITWQVILSVLAIMIIIWGIFSVRSDYKLQSECEQMCIDNGLIYLSHDRNPFLNINSRKLTSCICENPNPNEIEMINDGGKNDQTI